MDLPKNTHIRLRGAILEELNSLEPGLTDVEKLILAQAAIDAMVQVVDEKPVKARNGGRQAFPRAAYDSHQDAQDTINVPGMSVQTWLAGQAMKGLLGNDVGIQHVIGKAERLDVPLGKILATSAVAFADYLLVELEDNHGKA